jgi:hypothetical protein
MSISAELGEWMRSEAVKVARMNEEEYYSYMDTSNEFWTLVWSISPRLYVAIYDYFQLARKKMS